MIWIIVGALVLIVLGLIVVWRISLPTSSAKYPSMDPQTLNPEIEYFLDLDKGELLAQSENTLDFDFDQIIKMLRKTEFMDPFTLGKTNFWKNNGIFLFRPSKLETFYPETISALNVTETWSNVIPPYCFFSRNNCFCSYSEYDSLFSFHQKIPSYDLFFYDSAARRRFLESYFEQHILSAYESCRHEEHKQLFWALAIIYYYGGVYLGGFISFENNVKDYDFYFTGFGGILASRAGNNLILDYLEALATQINLRDPYYENRLLFDSEGAKEYWKRRLATTELKAFLNSSHRALTTSEPFY